MNKNHSMKRSLTVSVISLILCVSMLLGTTFAWFTDSVTSAGNIIQSGTLDINMYWSEDNVVWNDAEGANAAPVFNYDNWEPGYTEVRYMKVTNEGSLAFQYQMNISPNGAVSNLAEVIDVYYDVVTANGSFVAPTADNRTGSLVKVGTLADLLATNGAIAGGVLLPEGQTAAGFFSEEIVVCISLHMQETAGNEYQDKSIGSTFDIKLYATQFGYESDSFGDDYDDDAEIVWPDAPAINSSASTTVATGSDNKVSSATNISGDRIDAVIPEGVKVAEGANELTLSVKEVEDSQANVQMDETAQTKVALDVHIEGIAEDNTVPMEIKVAGVAPFGLNDSNIQLYHVENGVTVQMTQIGMTETFTAHNQFKYDAVTGDLILYMASFSEVAMLVDDVVHWDGLSDDEFAGGDGSEEKPYLIANASQLAYFRDIVDGKVEWNGDRTFKGQYVKLTSNIYLNHEGEFEHLWDPIGWGYAYSAYNRDVDGNGEGDPGKVFKGTFDGDRHAIHGLWQNGWDLETNTGTDYTYTNCGGGLFASVENATIKNLVMIDAIVTFECVEIGIVVGLAQGNCNFESIFIYDSKIANYQRPTGGIVGEISPAFDKEGNPYGNFTFKKIMLDTSVVVGTLWGDFDAPVGGIIGARWDDYDVTTVRMETCDIACELDVYNDVTSTYQWYAYRRAGMLIGNTDTSETIDGRTVATAKFLTCKDVDVYYGGWANYNYCQFTNNNSSWPWVRVQAGENCNAYSNPRYGVPNDVNGNKVVDYDHVHAGGDQCNILLTFNQLYGGGQGVYGQPTHPDEENICGVNGDETKYEVNTDVKYLITFMHDDHVGKIVFVEGNDEDRKVEFPDTATLPHLDQSKSYEWVDRNGDTVDTKNTVINEGNIRDIFYYLTEADKFFVHFVDKDGFYVAQYEFDPKTGELLNGAVAPEYPPEVPGYHGFWEPYVLQGAQRDVIVNAVYSKSETSAVLGTAGDLFERIEKGHELSMSQDLTGGFGSANQDVFCDVASKPETTGDTSARFDLNSFALQYNGSNSGKKDWTLFLIGEGRKLTVGDGLAGFGFLYFDLSKLNSGSKPTIFALEKDATLILERGVVIEFRYPKNNNNTIDVFKGVGDLSQYSGLQIENIQTDSQNIVRLTVNARTVLQGDGSYVYK